MVADFAEEPAIAGQGIGELPARKLGPSKKGKKNQLTHPQWSFLEGLINCVRDLDRYPEFSAQNNRPESKSRGFAPGGLESAIRLRLEP